MSISLCGNPAHAQVVSSEPVALLFRVSSFVMKRTAEPDSFSYEPYKFRRLGDPGDAWSHTEWTACGPEAVTPEPDYITTASSKVVAEKGDCKSVESRDEVPARAAGGARGRGDVGSTVLCLSSPAIYFFRAAQKLLLIKCIRNSI